MRTWRHLGLSWAVLEAILDHLGRTWRPSWPYWRPSRPSWRRFLCSSAAFHVAGALGRSLRGSSFGKEPQSKAVGSSTLGTPVINQQGAADLLAFGLSRHRACFGASWGLFWGLLGPLWGLLGASWGLLGRLGGLLRPSWPVFGPSWVRNSHTTSRGKPREIWQFGVWAP